MGWYWMTDIIPGGYEMFFSVESEVQKIQVKTFLLKRMSFDSASKHFKAMRFPWWQTRHGTNHESSPPWCNTAIWVEWNAVTHVTCPASSEQMIPSLRALVALDRDSCDTNTPKTWMVDVLWSLTSPGHELHFGPADLVHLSIRSFEFHLARLFYLKVRQKKMMTYTTSDCQPSRCFAPSLKRNCRKCIQRVLHPENYRRIRNAEDHLDGFRSNRLQGLGQQSWKQEIVSSGLHIADGACFSCLGNLRPNGWHRITLKSLNLWSYHQFKNMGWRGMIAIIPGGYEIFFSVESEVQKIQVKTFLLKQLMLDSASKHFNAMRFPWWQTHHGVNHELSPPWCNTAMVQWCNANGRD